MRTGRSVEADKRTVLTAVAKGASVRVAMEGVSRKVAAWDTWRRRDPLFAERSRRAFEDRDRARLERRLAQWRAAGLITDDWLPPHLEEIEKAGAPTASEAPAAEPAPPAPHAVPCPLCGAPLVVTPRSTLRCLSSSCGREVPA